MSKIQNFTLGTANLGSQYGVLNKSRFNEENSVEIIRGAVDLGIESFDTAPDYGLSEEILGKTVENKNARKFYSKIPKMSEYSLENIKKSCEESIEKIGINKLDGVLFHDPEAHKYDVLREISEEIVHLGIATRIGFSAYSADDLIQGKARMPIWSIFQIPENLANGKTINSRELQDLAADGNLIHIRSIFLQGLLLLEPSALPSKFHEIKNFVFELSQLANSMGVRPLDLCLSYSSRVPWSSSTVIAATSRDELFEILNYVETDFDSGDLPDVSPKLLDPRNWAKL